MEFPGRVSPLLLGGASGYDLPKRTFMLHPRYWPDLPVKPGNFREWEPVIEFAEVMSSGWESEDETDPR